MFVTSFDEATEVNYEPFPPNLQAFDMSRMNKKSIKSISNFFCMKKRIKSLRFNVKFGSLDTLKNEPLISQRFFTCCNTSIAVPLYIPCAFSIVKRLRSYHTYIYDGAFLRK